MKNRYLETDPNFVPAKKSKKSIVTSIIYYTVGAILSFFFILPLLYMIAASTKSTEAFDMASSSGNIALIFLPDFSSESNFFENYRIMFVDREIWKYALNSLMYAAIVIVFNVLINGLAGYVLAKFHFPGKGFFSFVVLFLIIVPVETSIVPLYMIVRNLLGLTGELSYLAVVLPSIISVFNIFLFTQFFSSIPQEYEEAMHIDGASRVRIFFNLILPLSKPIVATTMVFTFIGVWNDYVWPMSVIPYDLDTDWPLLPIQAALNQLQDPAIPVGARMAALVITTIPIFVIYAAAQKYIVKGFGTAGLKL